MSSEERPEAFAEFYAQVQWQEADAQDMPEGPAIGTELPVNTGCITAQEVKGALRSLKKGKAAGSDGLNSDLWKAIIEDDSAVKWATVLCQACWAHKQIPAERHVATVIPVFKKGSGAEPNNYRPISLLAIGYKLLAAIPLARLKAAGAEQRISKSQFGFVSEKGTTGALFLARRMVEAAWATENGKLLLLLLDWSKAFDKVIPAALIHTLRRFGMPEPFLEMINGIYDGRTFRVRDGSGISGSHAQNSGISQGCPLSPFFCLLPS